MPFPRQSIELVGNLGRNAEMRYTPSGVPTTNFSMAVTRQWKQAGEDKKETIWVNVTTWDKLAESCAQIAKGQQVMVKGYLKPDPSTGSPRVWVGNDGKTGASYELTAQEVWLSVFGHGVLEKSKEQGGDFGQFSPPSIDEEIPF
ncbi:MAG: single-stranded DNA-binding protein [Chloroflexota bacterium]